MLTSGFAIRLSDRYREQLRAYALQHEMTEGAVVRLAVREFLKIPPEPVRARIHLPPRKRAVNVRTAAAPAQQAD
jgi:hypothetical protein